MLCTDGQPPPPPDSILAVSMRFKQCVLHYHCLGHYVFFSVLDQKESKNLMMEGGNKVKHLRIKTLNLLLEKLMRATK